MEKKVVIDRATWNTGHRLNSKPKLFSKEPVENRCCLGFLGKTCGLVDDVALHLELSLPSEISIGSRYDVKWPKELFNLSHVFNLNKPMSENWEIVFAAINDAQNIDHQTRESWVKEGFKIILGYDVKFVGEYKNS